MYRVEFASGVEEQVALPADLLVPFGELMAMLETAPWSGGPLGADNPEGAVRSVPFGLGAFAVYLVLERRRVVELLAIIWAN